MKRSFFCEACQKSLSKYVTSKIKSLTCEDCGSIMTMKLPVVLPPNVTERPDKMFGINQIAGIDSLNKERKLDHYWKNEVPRLVKQYGSKTALEKGWAYFNERQEFCLYDKPPEKR